MVAKMAAESPILVSLSYDCRYKDNWSVPKRLEFRACNCNNFYITGLCVFYSIHMTEHFLFLCIWLQNKDTLDSDIWQLYWPPSWKICNCQYWFLNILTPCPFLHMNRHFIHRGVFRGGALGHGPPLAKKFFFDILKKLENLVRPPLVWALVASKNLAPLFEILNTPLFIYLCIWKQRWDRLDSNFRRPCWPPSWKI